MSSVLDGYAPPAERGPTSSTGFTWPRSTRASPTCPPQRASLSSKMPPDATSSCNSPPVTGQFCRLLHSLVHFWSRSNVEGSRLPFCRFRRNPPGRGAGRRAAARRSETDQSSNRATEKPPAAWHSKARATPRPEANVQARGPDRRPLYPRARLAAGAVRNDDRANPLERRALTCGWPDDGAIPTVVAFVADGQAASPRWSNYAPCCSNHWPRPSGALVNDKDRDACGPPRDEDQQRHFPAQPRNLMPPELAMPRHRGATSTSARTYKGIVLFDGQVRGKTVIKLAEYSRLAACADPRRADAPLETVLARSTTAPNRLGMTI